jgi:hypothetical protein
MNYIIKTNESILGIYTSMDAALSETELLGEILAVTDEELESLQREWRNQELKKSDWVIPITDHPERATNLTYRANLRDWPSTDSFPRIKPTL